MLILYLGVLYMQYKNVREKLKCLRKRSEYKNIPFDLDKEWLEKKLSLGRCETTGIGFSGNTVPFCDPFVPSIDRIDCNKGYTKNNCQVVVQIYNIAKADHNKSVLLDWAKAFVEEYEK